MFPGHLTNNLSVAEKCELRQIQGSGPCSHCHALGEIMVDSVGEGMVDGVRESLDFVEVVVEESLERGDGSELVEQSGERGDQPGG